MTDLKPEKRGPGRLLPVTWRGVRWSIVVALVLVLVAGLAYPELVSPLSLSLLLVALSSLLLMAAALLGYMFGKQEPSTTNDKGDAPSASKAPNAAAMSASLKTPILLPQGDVVILDVSIRNFRNIADLRLNLDAHSGLGGNWTCIAGLNGAGKSAVLQAVCLLLLGERLTAELGQERLRRMWRRAPGDDLAPELRAHCRIGDTIHEIYLPFSSDGIDRHKLAVHPDAETIFAIWQRLQTQLVTAYGATRNLSDYQDRRYGSLSRQVQRQMTLFDPLTQIANVDVLLQGAPKPAPRCEPCCVCSARS